MGIRNASSIKLLHRNIEASGGIETSAASPMVSKKEVWNDSRYRVLEPLLTYSNLFGLGGDFHARNLSNSSQELEELYRISGDIFGKTPGSHFIDIGRDPDGNNWRMRVKRQLLENGDEYVNIAALRGSVDGVNPLVSFNKYNGKPAYFQGDNIQGRYLIQGFIQLLLSSEV